MEHFTPFTSMAGGALIALSASFLLLSIGKIAGISGIAAGVFRSGADARWRRAFLLALVLTGFGAKFFVPDSVANQTDSGVWQVAMAGLLVGFGTRLGSGCTSGHGVCGIPRLSKRSFIAVLTFMGSGGATMWLLQQLGGAA